MRLFVRCSFCHRSILWLFYDRHRRRHTVRLPDGQMRDHVTLAPPSRFSGSLEGVPQSYRHPLCGVVTTVPEGIVRSYLANPFLYSERFCCCGCREYVNTRDLQLLGTSESLCDYMRWLQQEYVRVHGAPPVRRP